MPNLRPWTRWTTIDDLLVSRAGLDRFTLVRVRRIMHTEYRSYTAVAKVSLVTIGEPGRLGWLNSIFARAVSPEQYSTWLKYLGYSEHDVDEMQR